MAASVSRTTLAATFMRSYKVKFVSQTNAWVVMTLLMGIAIGGVVTFLPGGIDNESIAWLLVLISMSIGYFVWQKFVTGRSEWFVDSKQIKIVWTKRFPYSNLQDVRLNWSDIASISKGSDRGYYNLRIKLTTGETMSFFHDYVTWKDDFDDLISTLYRIHHQKR